MRKLLSDARAGNAIALVALFVALGGTAFAAATITSRDVRNNSLTSSDIRNNSLRGTDIRNSSLTSSDVRNGSLLAADFRAGQLPAGAQGPKGDKGDKGDTGLSSASTVGQNAGYVPISATTDPGTQLAQLILEPGAYLLLADVSMFTTDFSGIVACFIRAGGAEDRQEAIVKPAALTVGEVVFSQHLVANVAAAGTATWTCFKENNIGTLGTSGMRFTAVKLGSATSAVATP